MKQLHLWILVVLLTAVGLGVAGYKARVLGLPLSPAEQTAVWTVEASVTFRAGTGPVSAEFILPDATPGFEMIDEDFISARFGVSVLDQEDDLNRRSAWTVRRAQGNQVLYYRITAAPSRPGRHTDPFPGFPDVPQYDDVTQAAVTSLVSDVRLQSADIRSFTRELIQRMNTARGDEGIDMLRNRASGDKAWAEQLVELLAGARIPARVVWGLELADGARDAQLVPWLEVHNEREWIPFSPRTGESGYPADFLVWRIGNDPLVTLSGATRPQVKFSVSRGLRDVMALAHQRAESGNSGSTGSKMMQYSLVNLPLSTQTVYRVLLTVPLGAFLVALLRNLVGVKTFGTFMPVLIALSFRETELLWGVVLFTILVALGLAVRFYLEKLKLLLVPRLTAVLIIVILLMVAVSMLSHQLGLSRGLSIALFPMVILAMTIERMSLVWDEHGASEALMQGAGSLVVAAAGYLVMSNDLLGHLVFVFPELLLVLLAATLLLGRYTGYRLSELFRFRSAMTGQAGQAGQSGQRVEQPKNAKAAAQMSTPSDSASGSGSTSGTVSNP